MHNQKLTEFYDRVYENDQAAFSGEPLPLVKSLIEHLQHGSVLEIGAGAGRNSLFLAEKGFDIEATDLSPKSVEMIKQKASEAGISLKAEVADCTETELKKEYDAIICTFTFHHLSRADGENVIQKIQKHTKPGGFNILTIFTKDGDFYKKNPSTPNFYLENKDELEHIYKGWKIIKIFEKEGKARAVDEKGEHKQNTFAGLMAQKL
jgi:tellurite methyltransferase